MYHRHQSRSWSLAEIPDEIELRSMSAAKTMTNLDMEEPDLSFQLDSTWPGSIPNDENPTMKFTIENGIEVPAKNAPRTGLATHIRESLAWLEVGQSFLVPFEERKISSIQSSVSCCLSKYKPAGKLFISRKRLGEKPPGIRIWRLE